MIVRLICNIQKIKLTQYTYWRNLKEVIQQAALVWTCLLFYWSHQPCLGNVMEDQERRGTTPSGWTRQRGGLAAISRFSNKKVETDGQLLIWPVQILVCKVSRFFLNAWRIKTSTKNIVSFLFCHNKNLNII